MSEGYWKDCGHEEAADIIRKVERESGERFDHSKVFISRFYESPYDGFEAYRFQFTRQWAQSANDKFRKFLIPDDAYSIVLVKRGNEGQGSPKVICLNNKGDFVHSANFSLRLKLDADSVPAYVAFFGQVVHADHGPFYFLTKEDQIPVHEASNDLLFERLKSGIDAMFGKSEDGSYRLNLREKSYFGLGKAFLLDIPAIYSGALFSADMRVAENGFITMDEDDPTAIEGLSEFMHPSQYYPIDNSEATIAALKAGTSRVKRPILLFSIPQIAEKLIGILVMPVFALFMYIAFSYGVSNLTVFEFFELITSSTLLNWVTLISGGLMVAASVARFVFFSTAKLISTFVPNRTSMLQDNVKMINVAARKKMGILIFLLINIIEFIAIPFLGATILLYGGMNIFQDSISMNYLESVIFVATSLPLVPFLLTNFYNFDGSVGLYTVPVSEVLSWIVAIFFSTIILGVMFRVIALSRDS